ncbi:MAG TPA: acetylglutamate kinase [Firmicutes bacterium]|nr:acetylglutamate kinase [Bacillota bacterium]
MIDFSTSAENRREITRTRTRGEHAPRRVLVKYGGNAMVDQELVEDVLAGIAAQHNAGLQLVLVHGGGPYIKKLLDALGLESEFVGGHRRTDARTIRYIGMVLSGQVNGDIVGRLNRLGAKAVGLSGRDAALATVQPRRHMDSAGEEFDLGFVGDIEQVNPRLVEDLLAGGYLPVVAPISIGPGGKDYNVNADMFAGHLAAALSADEYLVLTDVDGLRRDREDPDTLIPALSRGEAEELLGTVIAGGMIPKVQSCLIAVKRGVGMARIVNGTRPGSLAAALNGEPGGTVIKGE